MRVPAADVETVLEIGHESAAIGVKRAAAYQRRWPEWTAGR